VLETTGDAGFLEKPLTADVLLGGGREQGLDRHAPSQGLIHGFEDASHAAAAEFAHDAILPEAFRGGSCRSPCTRIGGVG
jgi:hypothetical protein